MIYRLFSQVVFFLLLLKLFQNFFFPISCSNCFNFVFVPLNFEILFQQTNFHDDIYIHLRLDQRSDFWFVFFFKISTIIGVTLRMWADVTLRKVKFWAKNIVAIDFLYSFWNILFWINKLKNVIFIWSSINSWLNDLLLIHLLIFCNKINSLRC